MPIPARSTSVLEKTLMRRPAANPEMRLSCQSSSSFRSRAAPSRPTTTAAQLPELPLPESEASIAETIPISKATASNPKVSSDLFSDIYDVSDREKERIRKRNADDLATARQAAQPTAQYDLDMNAEQKRALEDSRRRRDAAMDRLADITSTSRNTTSDDVGSPPPVEYSRREEETTMQQTAARKPPRLTDASGLDLDDDMFGDFGDLDDTLDDTENAIEDTQNGHRSTDTSSFNIAAFKRRPRQSSIVGKDDAPIRPSSRGVSTPSVISTFNLGGFKRRAREPSILGTAQKERPQRPPSRATSRARDNVANADAAAADDSGPDDESTPLNKAKQRSEAVLPPVDDTLPSASPILTRKRKSLEDQGGREKRPALDNPLDDDDEIIHQSIEVESTTSTLSLPPSSPLLPVRRSEYRPATPEYMESEEAMDPDDPDMAPPMSSGSSDGGSPVIWPSLDSLAHRTYTRKATVAPRAARKTPETEDGGDAFSNVSSPPSLTHSPNYDAPPPRAVIAKTAAAAKPKKKPVATTADLTSLLPRRRHKTRRPSNADPFDIETSSDERDYDALYGGYEDGEDGDELSYVDLRTAAARRRKAKSVQPSATAAQKQPLGSKTANNRASGAKGKGVAVAAAEGARSKKRPGLRTYGSRSSDKENENDAAEESIVVGSGGEEEGEEEGEGGGEEEDSFVDAETSQMMLERRGEELHQAAKKFKEVDQWELSFEEVTQSSSPQRDAR
ncbi:hypothetical protein B0T17DRAFT_589515 [Bombardia bombarda]|uniref:Uncharacterized protein n=1 Tax=Bombardia bombarda TaxID=252184 RepID=A0AA40CA50_9PEZI|nr:hypothetical protein B0T17DRAFT_589515 [Bombardia bombarda]